MNSTPAFFRIFKDLEAMVLNYYGMHHSNKCPCDKNLTLKISQVLIYQNLVSLLFRKVCSCLRGFTPWYGSESCPSSGVALLFCHGSKRHFGSNGATNRALMESRYRLRTLKQLSYDVNWRNRQ